MSTHVAIVRQSYRNDGGAERFVARLIDALNTTDIKLTLLTRNWQDLASSDINVISCNPKYFGRLARDWSFSRAVSVAVRDNSFDLIQTNERIPGCDLYRAGDGVHRVWLSHKSRTQGFLGRLHTAMSPYHMYVKSAEKRVFEDPRLQAVICNSAMVKQEIVSHFDISSEKIRVIYNGIDSAAFHPGLRDRRAEIRRRFNLDQESPVFLFVGSGFHRKGLSVAIRATARIENARLAVVGNAKRAAGYRKLAQRLGCANRIDFHGVQKDVSAYYAMADALVLPTLYDPFPNVVLEAMNCALPVVTTHSCGAIDFIRSGENGYLCDALDVDGFEHSLRQLCDAGHARAIGTSGFQSVEHITPESMQRELTSLYGTLLETDREHRHAA